MKFLTESIKIQCQEIRENLKVLDSLMKTVIELPNTDDKSSILKILQKGIEAQLKLLNEFAIPKTIIEEKNDNSN